MNSEKVETWHGIIISTTWHVKKSRDGYGKNRTHFMYKLDNLFRSIRILDENSSATRALQYFLNLFEIQNFLRLVCSIQSDVINFQHVLTSFVVFRSFTDLFRELNDREIENHYKWNLKMSKLGIVSSFHPHSTCKRVERVTAKTGRTSCTNRTTSFEVSGFLTRTHLLHGHFIFLNLLQLQTFLAFRTHHSKRRHQFSKLSDIICYFLVIYRFL